MNKDKDIKKNIFPAPEEPEQSVPPSGARGLESGINLRSEEV